MLQPGQYALHFLTMRRSRRLAGRLAQLIAGKIDQLCDIALFVSSRSPQAARRSKRSTSFSEAYEPFCENRLLLLNVLPR
jgi:hypothetical protein